jgi:hypothetical protein
MKYVCSVEIHQSLARVIILFNNQESSLEWLPELVNLELVSGDPSDVGAISKLNFKTKTLDYEVIETITRKSLPSLFARTYKMRDIAIETNDSFTNEGKNLTGYKSQIEVSYSGLMLLVGWLMGWYFKKKARNRMMSFKRYAENYVELT